MHGKAHIGFLGYLGARIWATLNSPTNVDHNKKNLECTLIFTIRIDVKHINFQSTLNLLKKVWVTYTGFLEK